MKPSEVTWLRVHAPVFPALATIHFIETAVLFATFNLKN